jgi:hypothetical protein
MPVVTLSTTDGGCPHYPQTYKREVGAANPVYQLTKEKWRLLTLPTGGRGRSEADYTVHKLTKEKWSLFKPTGLSRRSEGYKHDPQAYEGEVEAVLLSTD